MRHGEGRQQWPLSSYAGQWELHLPHGAGKAEGGGTVYEGQWKQGRRHGTGTLFFADGAPCEFTGTSR